MQYGVKPEGMTPEDWTSECQCRFVARKMREGANRSARLAIFEEWQRKLPGVTKERVAEIWKQGVPMPEQDKRAKKEKAA